MVERKNKNLDNAARLARWSTSVYSTTSFSTLSPAPPATSNKKLLGFGSSSKNQVVDPILPPIDHDDLKQGSLYIVKIRNVSVALFEGWDDDMCCFAVLRSDSTPMRWSESRYIPGDFDAYDAFDDAGNPPVHLWTRYLHVNVPINWFTIFEEARRKQREWVQEQDAEYYYPADQQESPPPPPPPARVTVAQSVPQDADQKPGQNGAGTPPSEKEKEETNDDATPPSTSSRSVNDSNEETVETQQLEKHPKNEATAATVTTTATTASTVTTEEKNGEANENAKSVEEKPVKNDSEQAVAADAEKTTVAAATSVEPTTIDAYKRDAKNNLIDKPSLNTNGVNGGLAQLYEGLDKERFFNTEIAFPHDRERFSIQPAAYPQEPPSPAPAPVKSNSKKLESHGAVPAKTKRRSVQGLFRK